MCAQNTVRANFVDRKWLATLFLVALAVRCMGFTLVIKDTNKFYSPDSYEYITIARNLIQHGVFSQDPVPPLTPDIYRTPVYPALLAGIYALGFSDSVVVAIQIFLGSLMAAATFLLARNLELSRLQGGIAALIVALDPLTILYSYTILTDMLFATILLGGIVLLSLHLKTERLQPLIASSVILALASLTRPIGQYLSLALIPAFVLATYKRNGDRTKIIGRLLILILISLSLTNLWSYRNYRENGVATISAIGDFNLLYFRASEVMASAENISAKEAEAKLDKYIRDQTALQKLTKGQSVALMREKAIEIFRAYPKLTLIVHLKGLVKVIAYPGFDIICIMLNQRGELSGCQAEGADGFLDQLANKLSHMNTLQLSMAIWATILLISTYLSSVLGLIYLASQKNWSAILLMLSLIFYFAILSAGGESVSRFRIPFMPFLGILAGTGLSYVFHWFHPSSQIGIEQN